MPGDELHDVVVEPSCSPTPKTGTMLVWCSRAAARASRWNRGSLLGIEQGVRRAGPSGPRAGPATPARPRRRRPCRRGRPRGGSGSRPAAPGGGPPAGAARASSVGVAGRGLELLDQQQGGEQLADLVGQLRVAARRTRRATGCSPRRCRATNSSASRSTGSRSSLDCSVDMGHPSRRAADPVRSEGQQPGDAGQDLVEPLQGPDVAVARGRLATGPAPGPSRRCSAPRSAAGRAPRGRSGPCR